MKNIYIHNKMRKVIKKYGNSIVIILTPEDMKAWRLKTGDIIDISDIVKVKYEDKK